MLSREILNLIKDLRVFPVVVATAVEGNPHQAFITWVYPVDERTLRIALSSNSQTAKNLRENPRVAITLFSYDNAITLYGSAKELVERLEGVPFPVSAFEVVITSVNSNLFPGATVLGPIPFAHSGDVKKAVELDEKVISALSKL